MCDEITAQQLDGVDILNLGKTAEEIASNLYFKLREGEDRAELIIAIAPEDRDGIMIGVRNRLTKACRS
jgi:hypothetical protein